MELVYHTQQKTSRCGMFLWIYSQKFNSSVYSSGIGSGSGVSS
jgi:hypothetical protein